MVWFLARGTKALVHCFLANAFVLLKVENCHSEDEVRRISISWLAGAKPCDSSLRSERQTLCHTALDAVSQELSLSSTTFPSSSTEGRRSSSRVHFNAPTCYLSNPSPLLFTIVFQASLKTPNPSPLLFTIVFQAGLETPDYSPLLGRGRSCACTSKLQMRGEGSSRRENPVTGCLPLQKNPNLPRPRNG